MTREDVLSLLGDTQDVGSGIYIYLYEVDQQYLLRIPFASDEAQLGVTGEDLLLFSNQLISRAKHELSTAIAEARKEKYLTKEEVKTMCGVCDTTLWHWSKKNYLKPVKVGNKVRYRQSDIQRILGEHNPLI